MKNKIKSILGIAIAAFMLALCTPPAQAQVSNYVNVTITNQPAVVTTTATSNFTSVVEIRGAKGISLSWKFNQTSASTSNATLRVFSRLKDGDTSTVPFATLTAASTGATDVILQENWTADELRGYDALIIGSILNTTALTTLTNKGITVKREL
jgi:hypothetical protein